MSEYLEKARRKLYEEVDLSIANWISEAIDAALEAKDAELTELRTVNAELAGALERALTATELSPARHALRTVRNILIAALKRHRPKETTND